MNRWITRSAVLLSRRFGTAPRFLLRRGYWVSAVVISTVWLASTSYAQLTDYDLTTKYGYTGDQRTITWDQDSIATLTELEFEHVENGTVEAFSVPNPPLVWVPQRAGHYVVRARSCNSEGCSDWATSQDEGWWLFFWIKAPEF